MHCMAIEVTWRMTSPFWMVSALLQSSIDDRKILRASRFVFASSITRLVDRVFKTWPSTEGCMISTPPMATKKPYLVSNSHFSEESGSVQTVAASTFDSSPRAGSDAATTSCSASCFVSVPAALTAASSSFACWSRWRSSSSLRNLARSLASRD